MSDPYQNISTYYDSIVGKRFEVDFLQSKIDKLCPYAKSILEIACGTGEILKNFEKEYEVVGVDLSPGMLKVAKKKLKSGTLLLNKNMLDLDINKKFDVVLCVFNSINHLHKFSDWKKLFLKVNNHLKPGGVFIFDIVTKYGLKAFLDEPPVIEKKDGKVVVMQFKKAPRGMLDLRIKVFDEEKGIKSELAVKETFVREQSFDIAKIKTELKKSFSYVDCFDLDLNKVCSKSEVVFFTALK